MEQHVLVRAKTNKENWGNAHDEGANKSVDTVATTISWILSNCPNDEKYCSVAGMTTPRLDALPSPSMHAPDQPVNGSLIDGIPFLHQQLC